MRPGDGLEHLSHRQAMMSASEEVAVGIWQMWAKWADRQNDPAGGRATYWLPAHLADTAIYAHRLLTDWAPPRVVRRFDQALPADVSAHDVVVAAAALHDIGKATPAFQGQQLIPWATPAMGRHLAGLDGLDPMEQIKPSDDGAVAVVRRHETIGAVLLTGTVAGAGSAGVAALVAGHHGRWNIPDRSSTTLDRYVRRLQSLAAGWADIHTGLQRFVTDLLHRLYGLDLERTLAAAQFTDGSLIPQFTAVVTLADWLASNHADRQVADGPVATSNSSYQPDVADTAARRDISELVGVPQTTSEPPAALFGYPLDRDVQQTMQTSATRLQADPEGTLHVVQVPMGEGKTEAALAYWATRFFPHQTSRQGLYFALPTMATASAMLDRVADMFAHYGVPNLAALAHSQAAIDAFYQPTEPVDVGSVDQHGVGPSGGLVASSWFQDGIHRPLLAPVAVGTVDQLLVGTLRGHYGYLRLLAASTKTVILDEVHSYDPYMQELLRQFLRWAGHLGIDVVLLTATLPTELHTTYLRAYNAHRPGTAPTSDDTVPYPKITVSHAGTVNDIPLGVHTYPPHGRHYQVIYRPASTTAELVASLAADHPDARIGVIVNTVKRAQQIGRDLAAAGHEPVVFHARFPAQVRHERAQQALARFGQHGTGGGVLVATQVAEQSLNIDVDILVTDLCPGPSLVQRFGRCWRYTHRPRPTGSPTVYVLLPSIEGGRVARHDALPYHPVELERCKTALDAIFVGRADQSLNVPRDVQQLLDTTYLTLDSLLAADTSLGEDGVEADYARGLAGQQAAAAESYIPDPQTLARRLPAKLSVYGDGGAVRTRWFEQETVQVVLVGDGDGLLAPDRYDELYDLLALRGREHARQRVVAQRELSLYSLSLPLSHLRAHDAEQAPGHASDGMGQHSGPMVVNVDDPHSTHRYHPTFGLERNLDV